jgi:DNA-binding transcriptional regulator YhcF (GntR family)
MEKQKPGIRRACDYIDALKQDSKTPLPPIRLLAKSAGVSFVTMWKALKFLEDKGSILTDSQGNRIFSNAATKSAPQKFQPQPQLLNDCTPSLSRHHVTEKIYKDIVTGRFAGSERLPSYKELQLQYNVSFATLKKSLTSLVEQKIIEPCTNGYLIPSLTGKTGHARIAAIGCGLEDGKIWMDYQDKNYFRVLESECIRMNIQLDLIVYYRNQGRLHFVHTASGKEYDLNNRTILGYIFIVANLDNTPEEVLERLASLKRNVAVLDVVGGWKIPRSARENPLIQFFTATASVLPAKRVAQYLLGKGHRKVAFFSPFHRALWSQQRLNTINEMFARADIADGVVPFVYNKYAYQWDYLQNHLHQDELLSFVKNYNQWRSQTPNIPLKKFNHIGYSMFKYITQWNCASGEIYEKMQPLFEKALQDSSITAWVMANDFAATIAIDYLKERNIRVPDDLSIISFDNTLDAMEYQLTSYDFNNHGIITLMLRSILAPHTVKPKRKGVCIEVDGTLVIRRSC